MRRAYDSPGSFDRLLEAALAVADADSEDDVGFKAKCQRLRNAAQDYAAVHPRTGSAAHPDPERRQTVPASHPVAETSG